MMSNHLSDSRSKGQRTALPATLAERPYPAQLSALSSFLDVFAGRLDCFATWIDGDWRERTTVDDYRHHARWLTPRIVAQLWRNGRAFALYCLDDDGRSQIAAIDFDEANGLDLARGMAAWLITQGALPYLEPSREGRAHLWVR